MKGLLSFLFLPSRNPQAHEGRALGGASPMWKTIDFVLVVLLATLLAPIVLLVLTLSAIWVAIDMTTHLFTYLWEREKLSEWRSSV